MSFFILQAGLDWGAGQLQLRVFHDLLTGADTAPFFVFVGVSVQHKLIAAATYCGINLRAAGTVAPRPGSFKTACRITDNI